MEAAAEHPRRRSSVPPICKMQMQTLLQQLLETV
jgi:hypothetical protein